MEKHKGSSPSRKKYEISKLATKFLLQSKQGTSPICARVTAGDSTEDARSVSMALYLHEVAESEESHVNLTGVGLCEADLILNTFAFCACALCADP